MYGSASHYSSNPTPSFPRSQSQIASSSVSAYHQQPSFPGNSLIPGVNLSTSYAGQMQIASTTSRDMQSQEQSQYGQAQMQSINGMVKADASTVTAMGYPQQQQQGQSQNQAVQQSVTSAQQPSDGRSTSTTTANEDPALFVPLKTAREAVETMMTNDESLLGNGLDDHLGTGSMGLGGLARRECRTLAM
jgi:hypothetical protein